MLQAIGAIIFIVLAYTVLALTEAGDADLTDQEIMAQGRHRTRKVLPLYVKKTMRQVAAGAKKRRAARTNRGQLSE